MSRRARRPGTRARAKTPVAADPARTIRALADARGTAAAEALLDAWEEAVVADQAAFDASVAFLTEQGAERFTAVERQYLLACCAELADDPFYGAACERLEERLEDIAREWGLDLDHDPDDELREESPQYRAVSDALAMLRDALQVEFLCAIGAPEVARWLLHEPERYEQLFHEGPVSLQGGARLILGADDDPFGVLLP